MHDESESHSVMSDSLQPNGVVHVILQARILEWIHKLSHKGSPQYMIIDAKIHDEEPE